MTKKEQLQKAICKSHTGKMTGIQSLSTNTALNERCQKNASVKGSICEHCFAASMLKRYSNLNDKLTSNYELLTSQILSLEDLPIITNLYFRFEAFGDLATPEQVVNYFNICKVNKRVQFALWTKNPDIIEKAIKKYQIKKPTNLNIIFSSLFMNTVNEKTANKYSFIDKIFTVYDADYITENDVKINCGARSCLTCLKCYTKNKTRYISEKLK